MPTTENYIEGDSNNYPKAFLTSHDGGNFKGQIDDSCIWTIKRVMNVETWDFDYLRDLDRAEINKKGMDDGKYTMVYCME